METIAAGRIAFWEGGSLWVFDVPGDAPNRNALHAHHAFQLTFSLGGAFKLHLEDRIQPGPAALVAPDTPHAFEAQGLVALLFVAPESRAGRSLTRLTNGAPVAEISAAQMRDAPALIKSAFDADCKIALRETGMHICDRIAGHVRATEPDRRVRQMINGRMKNWMARLASMKRQAALVCRPAAPVISSWKKRGCRFAPMYCGCA